MAALLIRSMTCTVCSRTSTMGCSDATRSAVAANLPVAATWHSFIGHSCLQLCHLVMLLRYFCLAKQSPFALASPAGCPPCQCTPSHLLHLAAAAASTATLQQEVSKQVQLLMHYDESCHIPCAMSARCSLGMRWIISNAFTSLTMCNIPAFMHVAGQPYTQHQTNLCVPGQ